MTYVLFMHKQLSQSLDYQRHSYTIGIGILAETTPFIVNDVRYITILRGEKPQSPLKILLKGQNKLKRVTQKTFPIESTKTNLLREDQYNKILERIVANEIVDLNVTPNRDPTVIT